MSDGRSDLREERFAALIERVEGEAFFEGHTGGGVGDEVLWREDDQGGGVICEDALEAEPGAGGSFAELNGRGEEKVEQHEGESAVVQEHISGFDGFFGVVAADPKEPGEEVILERGGVEGIGGIDQGEPFAGSAGAFQERGNEQGSAGGGAGADDLGDGAFRESTLERGIEARDAGGPAVGDALARFGGHFDAGKFGGQELAQLDDVPGVM